MDSTEPPYSEKRFSEISSEVAINVWHGDKFLGILVSDAASIEDASLLGSLSGDVRSEPASDDVVSLLGLIGCCSDTSADGPHGLVCDDDLAPVVDLLPM